MSQTIRPAWIIERSIARGTVRIGVVGSRFAAELNGRPVKLANNDIASLEEIASSRFTAHMVPTLRGGGYTHLLGGQVALLPGEARTLKDVAMATPEGLLIHRTKLLEALEKEAIEEDTSVDFNSGLAQHGDERALRISPARQALNVFDERHPHVRAAMATKS